MNSAPQSPLGARRETPPRSLARRGFLLGAVASVAGGAFAYGRWFNVTGTLGEGRLSVQEAFEHAARNEILLIDIRRPDEWARTGVGQGAQPLDMRRADFIPVLSALAEGNKGHPIALICARGVRSRAMGNRLAKAGFTRILDVPEGMLGSGAGAGWLRAGLPVARP